LEVSLVDEVLASVGERALLPAPEGETVSESLLHDDELRGHAACLHNEPAALGFLEVPVEETREHAVEGGISEGECRRISPDEGGGEKSAPACLGAGAPTASPATLVRTALPAVPEATT
jgi:hypothetical protein